MNYIGCKTKTGFRFPNHYFRQQCILNNWDTYHTSSLLSIQHKLHLILLLEHLTATMATSITTATSVSSTTTATSVTTATALAAHQAAVLRTICALLVDAELSLKQRSNCLLLLKVLIY